MKKICIYILAAALLYSFFRELNIVKIGLIGLGLGAAYLIYLMPAKYIMAMKYPFICFTLAVTTLFIVYPKLGVRYPLDACIVFISFYGVTFYLTTIDEKRKSLFKDAVALSLLFFSSAFNLFMTGKPLLIFPIAIAIMFFLFILGKNRLIPFVAGYTLLIVALLFFFSKGKGMSIFGGGIKINDIEKYMLLSTSFILLVMGFIGFVKKSNFIKLFAFFGFLYIATDVFMVLGFRLSMGLLYQPVAALLVLIPLIGMMLKSEKERI